MLGTTKASHCRESLGMGPFMQGPAGSVDPSQVGVAAFESEPPAPGFGKRRRGNSTVLEGWAFYTP